MKFLIDECLSPSFTTAFAKCGYPDSIRPRFVGLRGAADHVLLARAFSDDRILVTANARDFKRLLAVEALHPGAIIVEARLLAVTWRQVLAALAFIEAQDRPADYMVNRVVEVSARAGVVPYELAAVAGQPLGRPPAR